MEFVEGAERMEKKKLWRILLVLGMIPFVIPFLGFAYEMLNSSSWTLFEYWFLYSFVYWPTYVPGLILVILSGYKLSKLRNSENN